MTGLGNAGRWPRPRVIVSRCLGFASCRYDATTVDCPSVAQLRPFADLIPVCPEAGAGLGVPREPIKLLLSHDGIRMVEPRTGRDRTREVYRFSAMFIASLDNVDGLILKSRSPSCAVKDARLYRDSTDRAEVGRGPGLFARMAMAAFPCAAVTDEVGLADPSVREEFLTKLFTIARFRAVKIAGGAGDLRRFHVENRLLLMARNRRQTEDLDRLLTCGEAMPSADLICEYEHGLLRAFRRPARPASALKVLMQIVEQLGRIFPGERPRLLETLEDPGKGKVGLAIPREIVRRWAAGFEDDDQARRTYLEPYPHELVQ